MDSKITDKLRSIPIFEAFRDDKKALAAIADLMTLQRKKAGTTLIREGQTGDELYILLRGEVEITKTTMENEQYTVVILGEEHNAFFGEMALLDDDKRSATITARKDCEVLALKRKDFEAFGNTRPEIALSITRELARLVIRNLRNTSKDVLLLFNALVNEVRSAQGE